MHYLGMFAKVVTLSKNPPRPPLIRGEKNPPQPPLVRGEKRPGENRSEFPELDDICHCFRRRLVSIMPISEGYRYV